MTPPALAVLRRCQKAVHDFAESIRRIVIEERCYVSGHRRQPNQIERRAPNQRSLVGGWRPGKSFFFEFCENEIVHPGPGPGAGFSGPTRPGFFWLDRP